MKKLLTILFAVALGLNLNAQDECLNPDVNCDGYVNVNDLLGLLGYFGDEDLDGDGIWDSQDDCVEDDCGICDGPGPEILEVDTIIFVLDSVYLQGLDDWYTYEFADTTFTLNCPVFGCVDDVACNFSLNANVDDGSCIYGISGEPGQVCDDGNALTYNDVIQETGCGCQGTENVDSSGIGPCVAESSLNFHSEEYLLVEIGSDCWFAENLRYLPQVSSVNDLSDSIPKYYVTGFTGESIDEAALTEEYQKYGVLYNGPASRLDSICPVGWKLPSRRDFLNLANTALDVDVVEFEPNLVWFGGEADCGIISLEGLCAQDSNFADWLATNATGFSAVPGGAVYNWGFYGLGEYAVFHANFETLIDPPWSAETYSGVFGIQQSLSTNYVYESSDPEIGASAIRCIKGEAAAGCNIVNACNYTSDNEDDDSTCLLPQSIAGNICDDGDSTTIYDVYQDDCFSCSGISELVASDGSGPCEGQDFLEFNSVLYELVEVSGNCWFKSNLRTELFANGDSIPSSFIETSDLAVLANSGFENLEAYAQILGLKYSYEAVLDQRMLCPSGWSIPKNEDWEPLNGPQWRNRPDDEFSWDGTNASGLSFAPDFDPSEGSGPVSWFWLDASDFCESCVLWTGNTNGFITNSGLEDWDHRVRCIKD